MKLKIDRLKNIHPEQISNINFDTLISEKVKNSCLDMRKPLKQDRQVIHGMIKPIFKDNINPKTFLQEKFTETKNRVTDSKYVDEFMPAKVVVKQNRETNLDLMSQNPIMSLPHGMNVLLHQNYKDPNDLQGSSESMVKKWHKNNTTQFQTDTYDDWKYNWLESKK